MDQMTVSALVGLAEAAMPLVVRSPFGTRAAQLAMEAIGHAISKENPSEAQIRQLDEVRQELERSVNEQAKRVAAKLGD